MMSKWSRNRSLMCHLESGSEMFPENPSLSSGCLCVNTNLLHVRNMITTLALLFSSLAAVISADGITAKDLADTLTEFHQSPLVSLLLIYTSQSELPVEPMMRSIQANREGYLNIKMIDCNTDDPEVAKNLPYCLPENAKQLPALLFSKPSLKKSKQINQGEAKPYEGQLNEKSLFNFAVPLMQLYSVNLRNYKDWLRFQEKNKAVPKIIYFTDKQKISPLYKALTANFRDTIAFAHSFKKDSLDAKLKVQTYPTFLLNGEQVIPAEPNLTQMIARLKEIEGEPAEIVIENYQSSQTQELEPKDLDKLVYKAAEYVIVHVPSVDGESHPELSRVHKEFGGIFKIYEGEAVGSQLGVKNTPSLVYFPKSVAKKNVQKTIFHAKTNFQDIYNEIDSMIEDFTVVLVDETEMQKHISFHIKEEKHVAILFHGKERSLAYKVISNDNKLQDEIAFFRMKDPNPEVIKRFQLDKIPGLIVMFNDKSEVPDKEDEEKTEDGKPGMNLKIAQYLGKFDYEGLLGYFRNFVSPPEPGPNHSTEGESSTTGADRVKNLKNGRKFSQHCLQENCYLLILDGSPEKQEANQNYINILGKESQKLSRQNFGSLDGVCHSEVVSEFDIMVDELPALVYVNSKFEKFSRMVGRIESGTIRNFFGKIQSNKGAMYRAYNRLAFAKKDCEAEHQRIRELTNQEAVLSEQEAVIIQELKEEDEKKRKEFSKANEKVRKKKKGKRPKKTDEDEL